MARLETELWSKGKLFRAFTIAGSDRPSSVSVRLSYGRSAMDVSEAVERFGLGEAMMVLSGYGRERWFWDVPKEEGRERLVSFRESAERAGFEDEGKAVTGI